MGLTRNSLNALNLIKNIAFSNFKRLRFPYRLIFALTYKCNLRCKTCLIWAKPEEKELTFEEILAFFKKSNDLSWIDLTGGEISLRDDLPGIIDLILGCCRRLYALHFPTNGSLPEKIISTARRIKNKRKAEIIVTVSIDGPEDTHDLIRGAKGSWRKAVDTFVGLKDAGVKRTYIGYTLSKFNLDKINLTFIQIKKIYPALTFDDLHINFFHRSEHYLNNISLGTAPDSLLLDSMKKIAARKIKKGVKNILEKKYFGLIPKFIYSKQMPLKCQALASSIFIDAYGDTYPCTIFNKKIGNIKEVGYELIKLWQSSLAIKTRACILSKKCCGCWTPCEAYPTIAGSLLKYNREDSLFKTIISP
jgi:Fe-coproporphyrin III synthase